MQSAQLSMQRAVLAHCTVCTIDYIKGCDVSRPSRHALIYKGGFTCGQGELQSPRCPQFTTYWLPIHIKFLIHTNPVIGLFSSIESVSSVRVRLGNACLTVFNRPENNTTHLTLHCTKCARWLNPFPHFSQHYILRDRRYSLAWLWLSRQVSMKIMTAQLHQKIYWSHGL